MHHTRATRIGKYMDVVMFENTYGVYRYASIDGDGECLGHRQMPPAYDQNARAAQAGPVAYRCPYYTC